MKLCSTATSPYGRLAKMVRILKGLEERVLFEVVQTRGADNPFYDVNPSGRVPCLILDDGTILEDSTLVCWFLDNVDGMPTLHAPEGMAGLEQRRLESMARSLFDGTSLWAREYLYREREQRSDVIINHERDRALRMADAFEKEVQGEVMTGPINMAQLTLVCVLHGRPNGSPIGFTWQDNRPNLCSWIDRIGQVPAIADTLPPPR